MSLMLFELEILLEYENAMQSTLIIPNFISFHLKYFVLYNHEYRKEINENKHGYSILLAIVHQFQEIN